jgi:hypothetical protein
LRVRRWRTVVEPDADLSTLLHEATGHAVAMRDAVAQGDERIHHGDRALYLVDVLNLTRKVAGIGD